MDVRTTWADWRFLIGNVVDTIGVGSDVPVLFDEDESKA